MATICGPHICRCSQEAKINDHLTWTERAMEGKWSKEMMQKETTRTGGGKSLNKAEWRLSHQKERWQEREKKRGDPSEAGMNPNKRTNVLCAPRNHMVLPLTQRVTLNWLKCLEEVKNTAAFGEIVPDLKWESTENKILVLCVPCGSHLHSVSCWHS